MELKDSYTPKEVAQIAKIFLELNEELSRGRIYYSEKSARDSLDRIWISIPENVRRYIDNIERDIDYVSRRAGERRIKKRPMIF